MTQKQGHELAAITLVYARCQCGWESRCHFLKGKSDEDLAAETMGVFEEHQKEMK